MIRFKIFRKRETEALFGSVESGRQTFGQWRIGSDRDRGVI